MTDPQASGELAERLLGACVGTLDLFHTYLGTRLGLYREMLESGPITAADLAVRCGIEVLPIENDFWRFYRLVE